MNVMADGMFLVGATMGGMGTLIAWYGWYLEHKNIPRPTLTDQGTALAMVGFLAVTFAYVAGRWF